MCQRPRLLGRRGPSPAAERSNARQSGGDRRQALRTGPGLSRAWDYRGSVTVNVAPLPSALHTRMVPPWPWTISRVMKRPSPRPP